MSRANVSRRVLLNVGSKVGNNDDGGPAFSFLVALPSLCGASVALAGGELQRTAHYGAVFTAIYSGF